jgi:predicted membrane channel-forming protein YqfA (hemolysin III family)
MGISWWAWIGAIGGAVFGVFAAMPNLKLYSKCPRWLARVTRTSALVYGLSAVVVCLFAHRIGDKATLALSIVLLFSAAVYLVGVLAAKRARSREAA